MFKKFNLKVLIGALTLVVVVALVFIVTELGNTPEKTIQKYGEQINKRDIKKSARYIKEDELDSEDYRYISGFYEDGYKANVIVEDVSYDESKKNAKLKCFLLQSYKGGFNNVHITINLEKNNGRWLLVERPF